MKRSVQQSAFEFKQRGGARPGAGRKRLSPRPLVPHRARPKLSGRHPLHVTLRTVEGVQSQRSRGVHAVLRAALREGAERFGLRVVHYGAASNHVHLVCEAESEHALARGMKGLTVRLAHAVNRFLGRSGALFADRYHARELKAPRDVRNVLAYVFGNARKHGAIVSELLDPCTSAACFDGWKERFAAHGEATWLARARTWLLTAGWRRHGLLSIRELPRGAPFERLANSA
ncbi:MAG: transposase [Planctomycetes bacterium]|nr:transposase [Planctomycetota bacterium]